MRDPITITLKSGSEVKIPIAPFTVGNRLLKALARELLAVEINLDTVDLSDLSGKDLNTLKNALLQLVQSDAVEAALQACMDRCTYKGQSIIRTTFEPEECRQDYLPIAWEVAKANLRPFFAGLDFKFLAGTPQTPRDPRPESTQPLKRS